MRWIKAIMLLLLTAACHLPAEDGALLKVDAYAEETPAVKTAVLRLKNKKSAKTVWNTSSFCVNWNPF